MRPERLVIDTNVFVSSLLVSSSLPARVIDHAVAHGRLLLTDTTRRELIASLDSSKFDKYVSRAKRESLMSELAPFIEFVTVYQIVRICRDARDDAILEAAFNGRADAIVTGDKDLLALHPFRGSAILNPADYLARIQSAGKPDRHG